MYDNLVTALRRKNITNKAAAVLIGVDERTFDKKVNGEMEFMFDELIAIHHNLLSEYRLDYLFARNFTRSA